MLLRLGRFLSVGWALVGITAPPVGPAAGEAARTASSTYAGALVAGSLHRAEPASRPLLQDPYHRAPYDGRFTFARVRYGSSGGLGRGWRGRGSSWAHDWPDGDLNLQRILAEFTSVEGTIEGTNVFTLEDPEIFRYPVLYVSEPGYWRETEAGLRNLRTWLLKGGFLILDDFEGRQWDNMAAQIHQALPGARWQEIDATHPIFRSFFVVEDIYVPHPLVAVTPAYYAIFEDDDPSKRIMVLANHNADLAEYWEYAAEGYFPMDPTNDAFRLGVNYVVYGLTH